MFCPVLPVIDHITDRQSDQVLLLYHFSTLASVFLAVKFFLFVIEKIRYRERLQIKAKNHLKELLCSSLCVVLVCVMTAAHLFIKFFQICPILFILIILITTRRLNNFFYSIFRTYLNQIKVLVLSDDCVNVHSQSSVLNGNLVYLCQSSEHADDEDIVECYGIGKLTLIIILNNIFTEEKKNNYRYC